MIIFGLKRRIVQAFAGLACSLLFTQVAVAQSGLPGRPSNATCLVPERPSTEAVVALEQVLNLSFPLTMVQAPNDPGTWYVIDRSGFINRYQDGPAFTLLGSFVDLRDRVEREFLGRDWGEMGLLGMAFHPDFANNGYVYIYYSALGSNLPDWPLEARLSRFTSPDGGLTLDPSSEVQLIQVDRDTQWHWGGQMLFGPDGYLYMSWGEAGRHLNAQNTNSLKGKMLRIDVDGGTPYAIPADNPFAAGGGRGEIYAYGFRNPWRFTFDSANGDIWLGDVGENSFEEINKVVKGGNYGWSILEGTECSGRVSCSNPPPDLVPPVYAYPHDPNSAFNAIIGGFVYRGTNLTNLQGVYIYGDNYGGQVYALRFDQSGNPVPQLLIESGEFLLSFAEGADGELFLMAQNGVYRIIDGGTGPTGNENFPQLLSETGCFDALDPSQPMPGLIPYDLNTPLWSDGAAKQRWMALPDGATIGVDVNGDFDFPIGTVLAKNFRIAGDLVETRLFMRHDDGGWGGYSYEWNDQQTDAALLPADKTKLVNSQSWFYPSRGQCVQCHTDVAGRALGPEIAQLNRDFQYPSTGLTANQLETLETIGMFSAPLSDVPANLPALAAVNDYNYTAQNRARSYLYANCAFCHQPGGPGQGPEDFRYWLPDEQIGAINEPPTQSNLGIPDALLVYPGQPGKSILSLRMHTLDSNRMPPLASSIVDPDGTGAVDEWIRSLDGSVTCGAPVYDPNLVAGLYVWEECGTGAWKARATAAGTYARIAGDVVSGAPFSFATPYSIESHDTFDISDPKVIAFDLQMWGASEDGFDFGFQPGSGACFTVNLPVPIRVGPDATPTMTPVNLETLGACAAPPPASTVNGRPTINPGVDAEFYLWRDVDDTWRVTSTAGGGYANYIGAITAEQNLSNVTPLSIEAHDVFDFTTDPKVIDFNLQIWANGEDDFNFRIPATGVTCIDLVAPVSNASVIVGAGNTRVYTPFNLRTLGTCGGGSPPGPAPSYNPSTDKGLYAWRVETGVWRFRLTAGGDFAQYIGSLSSTQPFTTVTGFSIEGHDVFTPGATQVDFNLRIWGSGQDGFDVTIPDGAPLCLDVSPSAGAEVTFGNTKIPISGPTDLNTLLPCTP